MNTAKNLPLKQRSPVRFKNSSDDNSLSNGEDSLNLNDNLVVEDEMYRQKTSNPSNPYDRVITLKINDIDNEEIDQLVDGISINTAIKVTDIIQSP